MRVTKSYICNREAPCKNSKYCGKECTHTNKVQFAKNKTSRVWVKDTAYNGIDEYWTEVEDDNKV